MTRGYKEREIGRDSKIKREGRKKGRMEGET